MTYSRPVAGELAQLRVAIDRASHLLPAQGPITVFIHHNTLHAFEDMPFEKAVERAAATFGCHPYLTEERFRDILAKGRIRFNDLLGTLEDELGMQAFASVTRFVTRLDLRMGMLQFPLRGGSAAELRWFISETDALRRVRADVSGATRAKLIAETRRWIMRDLRGRNGGSDRPAWVFDLFREFRATEIESWSDDTWESFTLTTLWRVCQEGLRNVPYSALPTTPPSRHRDLLLAVAWSVDTAAVPRCH